MGQVNQDGDPKRAVRKLRNEEVDDDGDDEAQECEPNYECVVCGAEQYIEDEHKSTAPAWCNECETVRDHWNIDKHE